jgi:hypothetical protein
MAITQLPADDLSDLDSSVLLASFARLLIGRYNGRPATYLARNALRLIDQSIREYQAANLDLRSFLQDGDIGGFFRAQGNLEHCVVTMHRALSLLTALRRSGLAAPDGSPLIYRPRELEVLTDPVKRRIRELRDAIVHSDDRLQKEPFPIGQPKALNIGNSGIDFCDVAITWDELCRWLRQLHVQGARFALS